MWSVDRSSMQSRYTVVCIANATTISPTANDLTKSACSFQNLSVILCCSSVEDIITSMRNHAVPLVVVCVKQLQYFATRRPSNLQVIVRKNM